MRRSSHAFIIEGFVPTERLCSSLLGCIFYFLFSRRVTVKCDQSPENGLHERNKTCSIFRIRSFEWQTLGFSWMMVELKDPIPCGDIASSSSDPLNGVASAEPLHLEIPAKLDFQVYAHKIYGQRRLHKHEQTDG